MLVMRLVRTYVMRGTRFAREQAREQEYTSCAFLCRYNKHAKQLASFKKSLKNLWKARECQVKYIHIYFGQLRYNSRLDIHEATTQLNMFLKIFAT